MAIDTQIIVVEREGDDAQIRPKTYSRRSYTCFYENTVTLTAGTKTEIKVPFSTIQYIYLDTGGETVYVYKNLSPEYWGIDNVFVAFDVEVSQIHLKAPDGASVHIFLGGE